MDKNFKKWVHKHSINGPSSVLLQVTTENELQIFHNIREDIWLVIDNKQVKQYVKNIKGVFYILLKSEFINYLKLH